MLQKYGTERTVSVDVPIDLNIAGNGSGEYHIQFKNYFDGIADSVGDSQKAEQNPGMWNNYWPSDIECSYEVKSISGTVKRP